MNFGSDNISGVSPQILEALKIVNEGAMPSYGADDVTTRLTKQLCSVFEREVVVLPVATGTAANVVSLSTLCPPYGAIFCHEEAHIYVDECGAPELYTGGAKLIPMASSDGKVTPEMLESRTSNLRAGDVHQVQKAVLSITQATELGTVYGVEEIAALSEQTRMHGMSLHMDGARFANALVQLGCSPAEMTWKAGVDVLSFGATKNGAMGAEAVIFFDSEKVGDAEFRRKRGGHLFSKMRYLSAQLLAYLENDLWLENAKLANACATDLARGLQQIDDVTLTAEVEANEVFAEMPVAMMNYLLQRGAYFYPWGPERDGRVNTRLVTAWNTHKDEVETFLKIAREFGG